MGGENVRWRITIASALLVVLLFPIEGQGHNLWKHRKIRVCMGERYDWRRGPEATARMIRCYARRIDPAGTPDFAVCVARRESGLRANAVSPSGQYLGLFQQSKTYWPARYQQYGAWSHLAPSALNGRTNTVVSLRMAKHDGWYHWPSTRYC